QGGAMADFREVAAVEQLEKLNGELNITNAAVAGFCVEIAGTGLGGLVLDAAFDRLDLVDLAETQILAVDERLDDRQEFLAQFEVASHGADRDEGLAFPGSAEGVVARHSGSQEPGLGTWLARRPPAPLH